AAPAQEERAGRAPAGSVTPQTPDAEAATFRLPPGYRVELVASEPLVCEPALCVFDGDGRAYVAELCTYMQDIDGTGEDEPRSRISVLFDDDGDGRMDRRTTFAEGLVLPRLVLPLDDRVIVGETYSTTLWVYRDADRDGRAESRELLREGRRDGRNLEHQDSALTWGIDNWLYTAMGGERLRLRGGRLLVEKLPGGFAQWGLAVDDVGRQFFSAAGSERPAFGFQRHPRYGRVSSPGELADGFVEVFPAIATPDVEGGSTGRGAAGTLTHCTGCCGQTIYRGDALPDCRGDYFLGEPVGRLVRRAEVRDADGELVLANRHARGEFLTSTDMNFRPVWATTGPDGALWVVDMYRGIIQEGQVGAGGLVPASAGRAPRLAAQRRARTHLADRRGRPRAAAGPAPARSVARRAGRRARARERVLARHRAEAARPARGPRGRIRGARAVGRGRGAARARARAVDARRARCAHAEGRRARARRPGSARAL